MKSKALLMNVLLGLTLVITPAFAESKSLSVQVSCFIPPSLEMASADPSSVRARSALGKQYQMSEDTRFRDGYKTLVHSLVAL